MKGDFSRDTFLAAHRFTRVLMQQGRVQLDADWNEQAAILLYLLRATTTDMVGRFGGPRKKLGFEVTQTAKGDFTLSPGHYYVDGWLCENRPDDYTGASQGLFYTKQNDLPGAVPLKVSDTGAVQNYLVYLDAWEQHITYLQEDDLREYALNGADTATRARLVTQVKVATAYTRDTDVPSDLPAANKTWKDWLFDDQNGKSLAPWDQFVDMLQPPNRGMLKVRGRQPTSTNTEVCLASPDGRYRGAENQLYRVEIHHFGNAWQEKSGSAGQSTAATLKWSRENGCVVFPLNQLQTNIASIERARDDRLGLHVGEWVEIVSDVSEVLVQPGTMAEVVSITPSEDPTSQLVKLRSADGANLANILPNPTARSTHPMLRRWDSRVAINDLDPKERQDLQTSTGGAMLVEEGKWIDLEDGIQVWFDAATGKDPHWYRSGDYWQIPARTALEDVIWPDGVSQPPKGVNHHYAPLAMLPISESVDGKAKAQSLQDKFDTLVDLTPPG